MHKLLPKLLFLICCTSFNSVSAQTKYNALQNDPQLKEEYLELLKENLKESKKQPKEAYTKELYDYYDARYESSVKRLEHGHYLLHKDIDTYLEKIKKTIADANPGYDFASVKILIARYTWPNAFSVGDGTIAINIGLMEQLENESELVFVICHELAHYFLNHADRKFLQRYNTLNSDEFKEKIEQIEKDEYYQTTKLKALLKANIYSERSHSREHEYEADSLGLDLYIKCKFNFNNVVKTLNLLDKLNDKDYDTTLNVYSLFKVDSVKYATSSLAITDEVDKDALDDDLALTHPECMQRIEALKKRNLPTTSDKEVDSVYFIKVVQMLRRDKVNSYIDFGELDKALLDNLSKKSGGNNEQEVNSSIIIIMEQLVSKRKDHRLSEVASKPNEFQGKSANELSNLLFGLRFKYLANAFYEYALELYNHSLKDENTMYSLIKLAKMAGDQETVNDMVHDFDAEFPQSEYTKEMKYWLKY